ncbi:MAG: hypothetical protein Q9193_000190 [Seirophora villosa]
MTSPKISVYSLSDLKNATDDALPNYLTSLKFERSHTFVDVRLGLGYSAVAISGVTFYADYKLGWDATKSWTLWAVIAYFILNGALTYWIWGVEKGMVFTGQINNSLISIASSVSKHKPIYSLKVHCGRPGRDIENLEFSAPFTRWFDSDGYFVPAPFQRWLASEIPLVGEADPRKVDPENGPTESIDSQGIASTQASADSSTGGAPLQAARSRKSKRSP